MFTLTTSAQVQPGRLDEATRTWREQVLPIVSQHQGLKGVTILGDRATNEVLVTTFWETEAALHALATNDAARQQITGIMAPFLAGPPTQKRHEVLFQA